LTKPLARREFLGATVTSLAGLMSLSLPRLALAQDTAKRVDAGLLATLEASPYVYVCPLRRAGAESTCHAEVWFAWLDDSVVVTVGSDGWKARSLRKGLDRARLWVGDYGRWKGVTGGNEKFRKAPSFIANAEKVTDRTVLDRLLARYAVKYPAEIGRWDDKMRRGFDDGSRTLIRYTPIFS
jgi:hypothetical protein